MKTVLISIGIFLIVAVAFGYFVSQPVYRNWQSEKRKSVALERELRELRKKRGQLKDLVTQESLIKEKATIAKKLLPADEEREKFVHELDALAKATNVNLTTIQLIESQSKKKANEHDEEEPKAESKTTEPVKKETTKPLGFKFAMVGDYLAVKQLLNRIRTIGRYASLTNVLITSAESGVSVTVDGNMFTRKAPKIPDKIDFSEESWKYLDAVTSLPLEPPSGAGRTNPFAGY